MSVGPFRFGRFGGTRASGASQNDDAAFAIAGPNDTWECAAVVDAHGSDDSARVMVEALRSASDELAMTLTRPVADALLGFQSLILRLLTTRETVAALASCDFETAVLAAARRDRFVSWVSVGDNPLLLFHPQLAQLGQHQLNQRQFFEWVGNADSLRLPVACYSSGVRELREGRNVLALVTDGFLEYINPPTEPRAFYNDSQSSSTLDAIQRALLRVQGRQGRDSATVIAWDVTSPLPGLMPTTSSA